MLSFEFNTTKSIINGPGGLNKISEICDQLNITKLLVVTDQGIVNCGLVKKLKEQLHSKFATIIFDGVSADPKEQIVLSAVALAKQHNVDGVIGFGGGSSMDTAKVVAVMMDSNQPLEQLYGLERVQGGRVPLVLIPTTAGTGSEVTPIAVLTTGETTKDGIVSKQLLPDVALLDAQLTLGLPAHVTAATGIDAMVHAIEAYTSKHKKNAYSDMLAKQALLLLSRNIEQATHHGEDIDARQNMLLGACLAGQAFANAPVAAVHALAYPLGGHFHVPHGLGNSLVLPHVMRFNQSDTAKLYSELAPYICEHINTSQSDQKVCSDLIAFIERLIERLKLPRTLKQLDIGEHHLEVLATDAMLQTRLLINNPKPLSHDDALLIYQAAYEEAL
ncbi:iron-containing alcohol dehydrogenase [Microbulbifer variabilis]|uniref:Iron-containing alcohol dehydrogenase n=1 Tax=Microbulbifer variabilis TaxID=266805 RepID=A0ABY4VLI6_9GAMM|nr:iron-containing alcohol dehydrogenase [Microbulbifer variabilis]USD23297.1 iron-containing alcohol dehydrogenase [Microbulbifer variabilis]